MIKPTTLLCLAVFCGCGLPRDRAHTLEHVEHGALRAGVTHHPPAIDCSAARPAGDEVALLEHLAKELDAKLTFRCASEAALVASLRAGELDIAAGAFDGDSPWLETTGSTTPYERHSGRLFLTPPGENRWLLRLDELIHAGLR